ncbi:hypothetical protein [Burkholderia gladioli]|uniref:hypothetical protein n=1 Tax=Burkholderia gladioli TaxID=28095 RepID=UPI00163F9800|nr:hypothetical protein [Burkholderia gladioli]
MGRRQLSEPRELNLANVFMRMIPGKTYPAYVIAAKFKVPTHAVRPLLNQLVLAGDVEHSNALPKNLGFRRPGQAQRVVEHEPDCETSIAGPAIPPDLTSTLTGYDAALRRQFELSKLARTR